MAVWVIQTGAAVIKCRPSAGYELKTMVIVAMATGNLTALFCQLLFFFVFDGWDIVYVCVCLSCWLPATVASCATKKAANGCNKLAACHNFQQENRWKKKFSCVYTSAKVFSCCSSLKFAALIVAYLSLAHVINNMRKQ